MSGASKRANGRASGPVLQSVFLAVLDHSAITQTSPSFDAGQSKGRYFVISNAANLKKAATTNVSGNNDNKQFADKNNNSGEKVRKGR